MSYMDELNFWQSVTTRQKWKIVFTRNWNSVPAVYVA